MRNSLIILYIVCFGIYVLYTRKPDFFDGERSPATIQWMYDSTSHRSIPKAVFRTNLQTYAIDGRYIFREWKDGDKTEVIYETEDPSKGAVYSLWGYWFRWTELLGSIVALIALFQVAVAITSNPAPEAVIDQLESKSEKKRKYLE